MSHKPLTTLIPLFSTKELLLLLKGKALSPLGKFTNFNEVNIDTRKFQEGQAFVALRGKNHDGHAFVPQAVERGASLCFVDRWDYQWEPFKEKSSFVLVEDTLKALQKMAHFHRKKMLSQIIAITGSNGKTSTKEFAFQILSSLHPTHCNESNFNNHIGLPLTLLKLKKKHVFGIVEMGTSSPGEIASLVRVAEPNISLCTNVSEAHIEFFTSKEAIAEEKSQIYQSHQKEPFNRAQIFNLDNPYTLAMYKKLKNQFPNMNRWTLSTDKNKKPDICFYLEKTDLSGLSLSGHITGLEKKKVFVPVFGSHNIYNLMSAAGLSLAAGLSPEQIWDALPICSLPWGRNQVISLPAGPKLIFDGYNANPSSVMALINSIEQMNWKGGKAAILGEMLELGEEKEVIPYYREIAQSLLDNKYHWLWLIASSSKVQKTVQNLFKAYPSSQLFLSSKYDETLAKKLFLKLGKNCLLFIKGSRGIQLERCLTIL